MDESTGFGLYQSSRNRGSVGRVSVMRWCGWCRRGVGRGAWNRVWKSGWCYVCVICESGFFV